MNHVRDEVMLGQFYVDDERKVSGELKLSGPETELILRDKEFFHIRPNSTDIFGYSTKERCLSLYQCVVGTQGRSFLGPSSHCTCEIFPHYVLIGDRHLERNQKEIRSVQFTTDDTVALFNDHSAFGTVVASDLLLKNLLNEDDRYIRENLPEYHTPTEKTVGEQALIQYYTGKTEIISTSTEYGIISVRHLPTFNYFGPRGASMENNIYVKVDFNDPIIFDDSISIVRDLLSFFRLIIGRFQNLITLSVDVSSNPEEPDNLEVNWIHYPTVIRDYEKEFGPQSYDVLLDPIERSSEFSTVLSAWISRQNSWIKSRNGFLDCFGDRSYTTIRLVQNANMFDHIPDAGAPNNIELPDEISLAKEKTRKIFKSLPESDERHSILIALKKLGKLSMKNRAKHRVRLIQQKLPKLETLEFVTSQAIDCRNYFVHGSSKKFDYEKNWHTVFFLTDCLEFVHGASDLIECGWNFKRWHQRASALSHPFGNFLHSYDARFKNLKKLVNASHDEGEVAEY